MVKNFITELTKVTDFFIIIATVFVFLAFLTPAEKSMQPLIDKNENELSSILNNRSQLISILESLRQQEASLKIELNTLLDEALVSPADTFAVAEARVSIEADEAYSKHRREADEPIVEHRTRKYRSSSSYRHISYRGRN